MEVSLAQGSPDLDSPRIGATGGVLNIYMREPSKKMGGLAGVAVGANNASQEFFRLETGQVGDFRGYACYSHNFSRHWNDPAGGGMQCQ